MGKMESTGDRDDMNLQATASRAVPANATPQSKEPSPRESLIKIQILAFYRTTGRPAPLGYDMALLVDAAMVDWKRVPDGDLIAVCALARQLAAQKPSSQGYTNLATTAEVLAAWRQISEKAHLTAYQRREREEQALIASKGVLPAPTIATLSPDAKEAFWDEFYRSAGMRRP